MGHRTHHRLGPLLPRCSSPWIPGSAAGGGERWGGSAAPGDLAGLPRGGEVTGARRRGGPRCGRRYEPVSIVQAQQSPAGPAVPLNFQFSSLGRSGRAGAQYGAERRSGPARRPPPTGADLRSVSHRRCIPPRQLSSWPMYTVLAPVSWVIGVDVDNR